MVVASRGQEVRQSVPLRQVTSQDHQQSYGRSPTECIIIFGFHRATAWIALPYKTFWYRHLSIYSIHCFISPKSPALSPALPLSSTAFPPQPACLRSRNPDTPIPSLLALCSRRHHPFNNPPLIHQLPKSLTQILPFPPKIASAESIQYPTERLVRNTSLGGVSTARKVCELGNCIARGGRSMGVVVEAFRLRDLGGEAGWEEVATEVEAERGGGKGFLCCRVDRFFLCLRVDGSHPGHGGGVGWQGGKIV